MTESDVALVALQVTGNVPQVICSDKTDPVYHNVAPVSDSEVESAWIERAAASEESA